MQHGTKISLEVSHGFKNQDKPKYPLAVKKYKKKQRFCSVK